MKEIQGMNDELKKVTAIYDVFNEESRLSRYLGF